MLKSSELLLRATRRMVNRVSAWYWNGTVKLALKDCAGDIQIPGRCTVWNDNVSVGSGTRLHSGVVLWGPGSIEIGSCCEVGFDSVIYSQQEVHIGSNCLFAAGCYIIDSNHGIERGELIRNQKSTVKGPVVIGDDVWLGAHVVVTSGVTIGDGAVIGAGAVVNRDIPPYAIAVGVPAKVVGYRKGHLA